MEELGQAPGGGSSTAMGSGTAWLWAPCGRAACPVLADRPGQTPRSCFVPVDAAGQSGLGWQQGPRADPQVPSTTPGAELQQKPQRPEQPCWWLPCGQKCRRTDGQTPRAAWGCTGLVCGWCKRGDAEKLGLGGSCCGSSSGCGGQKDGCRLRIPSVLSAGRAAGGRTEAGSAHGQHGLEAADPAGQTDGRWTEQPAWLRTDRQTDVGWVVGEYRP